MVIKQLIILSLSVLAGGHQEEVQAGVNKEVCQPRPCLPSLGLTVEYFSLSISH